MQELEEKAERLAREAFAPITDRMGRPYIGHVERVAQAGKCPEARIVGWLHDLVEDTNWSLQDLRDEGFPEFIVDAVDAVTRRVGQETYKEFIERIAQNPLAILVKLADLRDNRGRCEELPGEEGIGLARRYDKALARLEPLEGEMFAQVVRDHVNRKKSTRSR